MEQEKYLAAETFLKRIFTDLSNAGDKGPGIHVLVNELQSRFPGIPQGGAYVLLYQAYMEKLMENKDVNIRAVELARQIADENEMDSDDLLKIIKQILNDHGLGTVKMSDLGIDETLFLEIAESTHKKLSGELTGSDMNYEDIVVMLSQAYSWGEHGIR